LDAPNLETTATLQSDGSFILNTPHPSAAKYMPPTGPFGGMPKVAVVIARLMVNGEDRGVRPFIVTLGDGKEMAKGISAR
jgi:acyl-CoA oxidase